jgi:hypothetical protein
MNNQILNCLGIAAKNGILTCKLNQATNEEIENWFKTLSENEIIDISPYNFSLIEDAIG